MYEKYQVLFVDDEEDILRSLKRGLIDEEYSCHFATGALKAFDILEQYPIAVLVTDMRMPAIDGLKFLKEVRERWPQTIRIVLSGYVQLPQIILTINQVGVFRFITKPWRLEDDFINTIRSALDVYIQNEEAEHYVKKLEAQNALYQSLIRKLTMQSRWLKKSIEYLAALGKALVNFDHERGEQKGYLHSNVFDSQTMLFDLFGDAIVSKKETYESGALTEKISQLLRSNFQPVVITSLTEREMSISISFPVLEALLRAVNSTFSDEFRAYGASARIGVESNGYYCIYLVTTFDKAAPEAQSIMNEKLQYASSFLEKLALLQLNCFAEQYSERIVIGIFINM